MAQPAVKAQIGPQPKADRKRMRVKTTHTHNPIAQRRWRQLLSHLRPQSDSLYPIDTQNPTLAAKQLLQLGNYLLSLQDELSEWPINKRHFVMMPSQLVIYQEERLSQSHAGVDGAPPSVLRFINTPRNNRRWLQRPWRSLANLTQRLARQENDTSLKLPLQAAQGLAQLLSFSTNPDLFDIERTCKKGFTILHNHIQGAGLPAWSPAERDALAQTASRRGFDIRYNDEWCDYLAGLVDMLEQVASGLAESSKTSGQTSVKLGIASQLPDGRQYVHDLSDLFPGGSLTAVRPITPTDREILEKLFHQNDSSS